MIYLWTLGLLSAEPKPPYSINLDAKSILPIPIHTEIDTLLIFPEEVTSIIGKGLINGEGTAGSVLYVLGQKNPKTIILRHLDNSSIILMTVMLGDIAYAFRIEPTPEPASVIYFEKPGEKIQRARKISAENAQLRLRPPSKKRQLDLIQLSKQSSFLKPRLPHLYKTFSEREADHSAIHNHLHTTVTKLSKFEGDDALIFTGTIHNTSNLPIDLAHYSPLLKVGAKNLYPPTKLRTKSRTVAPGATLDFEGILLGDGKGNPTHFSLNNQFKLTLTKHN